jgi:serine O-acetyltransferase
MAKGYFAKRKRDIQSVLARDPAARSAFEVVTCYPGYKAVRNHRCTHWLWEKGFKWLARYLSKRSARRTGIEIHPGAQIGDGLFIDHGHGVVIGETTVIGDDVTLYQGVTLGGTGKDAGKRHPTLGDGVVVGAGAKVLGPFTVGDRSKVGAGAIVLQEVPPDCTVVGNPGRVVRRGDRRVMTPDLDQVHLPDPVKETIDAMTRRINALEICIMRLSEAEDCSDCPDRDTKDCFKMEGELKHADL